MFVRLVRTPALEEGGENDKNYWKSLVSLFMFFDGARKD